MRIFTNTLLVMAQVTIIGLVGATLIIMAFLAGVVFVSATAESQNRPVVVRTVPMKSKLEVKDTLSSPTNLQPTMQQELQPTWSPQ